MMPTTRPALDRTTSTGVSDVFTRDGGKPAPAKSQTVLLVDEDALRGVMEACLGIMGYAVIPYNDAQTASLAFRSSFVDILLTDLQMPGRSGLELAAS